MNTLKIVLAASVLSLALVGCGDDAAESTTATDETTTTTTGGEGDSMGDATSGDVGAEGGEAMPEGESTEE